MEDTAPGIEKRQFLNQSGGWEGVVTIDGKGDAKGASVPPGGRVWLSDAEVILTAEAPQSAENNPFEEQTRIRTNPTTGVREEFRVRPLVPVTDRRFVPGSERYIPPTTPDAAQTAAVAEAARSEEPATVTSDAAPRADAEKTVTEPPVPARARQAVQGNLSDASTPPPAQVEEKPPATLGGDNPSQEGNVSDETAATVDQRVGEETGAAPQPQGAQPEGEYAQHEEVGTPEAAEAPSPGLAGPPAPWSPGSQPS